MSRRAYCGFDYASPNSWKVSVNFDKEDDDDTIDIRYSVRFPQIDYDIILERFKAQEE